MANSFLKWAGGKKKLVPELIKRMPQSYDWYYEPFVGGGALYFEAQPKNAIISDYNYPLVLTYFAVRSNVEQVISEAKKHLDKHSSDYYYTIRDTLNLDDFSTTEIAGRFIYLNKTCYNGLYRVNKSGKMNVPIGKHKNINLNENRLREASNVLENTTILHRQYNGVFIKSDAFYYLDPPYYGKYSSYVKSGFPETSHIELAHLCKEIDLAGGFLMTSNSNTEFVKELYKDYTIEEVYNTRSISCSDSGRKKEKELIIRNYG